MSSSSWSTDELSSKGRGYADGVVASSSSGSSTSGTVGSPERREIIYEDIELNVDNSLVWTDITHPPIVKGYDWAPHEVRGYPPYFITTTSVMQLIKPVDLMSNIIDDVDISLGICHSFVTVEKGIVWIFSICML